MLQSADDFMATRNIQDSRVYKNQHIKYVLESSLLIWSLCFKQSQEIKSTKNDQSVQDSG